MKHLFLGAIFLSLPLLPLTSCVLADEGEEDSFSIEDDFFDAEADASLMDEEATSVMADNTSTTLQDSTPFIAPPVLPDLKGGGISGTQKSPTLKRAPIVTSSLKVPRIASKKVALHPRTKREIIAKKYLDEKTFFPSAPKPLEQIDVVPTRPLDGKEIENLPPVLKLSLPDEKTGSSPFAPEQLKSLENLFVGMGVSPKMFPKLKFSTDTDKKIDTKEMDGREEATTEVVATKEEVDVQPADSPSKSQEEAVNNRFSIIFVFLFVILLMQSYLLIKIHRGKRKKGLTFVQKIQKAFRTLVLIIVLSVAGGQLSHASSDNPTQGTMRYQGRLRLPNGSHAQGNYIFRMSFWKNKQTQPGDFASGNINTQALDYKAWQEEISVTVNEGGYFSLVMGKTNHMPTQVFNTSNGLYLQIEVKPGSNGTPYILIDASPDPTENRRGFTAVPYAKNAERLDSRDPGFEAGNVPFLNEQAQLLKSAIPSGTHENLFTIDANNDAAEIISLKFGDALGKILAFNKTLDRFEFNDTVSITGDLVITGTINGASVGVKDEIKTLVAPYENKVFLADGTNNFGSMYEDSGSFTGQSIHILKWATQKETLQDYTIEILYTLPSNFKNFRGPTPVHLLYTTEGNAKIDVKIEKNSVAEDALQGSGIALQNAMWTQGNFSLQNPNSYHAGDVLKITLQLYSHAGASSSVSNLLLEYQTQ